MIMPTTEPNYALADAVVRGIDPTKIDRWKREPLVWTWDAFPGFASGGDWATVRQIVASSPREIPEGESLARSLDVLPRVECGEAAPDGQRCGRRLSATAPYDELRYCEINIRDAAKRGHEDDTSIDGETLQRVVRELTVRAYSPEHMATRIARVRERIDELEGGKRRLEAQRDHAKSAYAVASRMEHEALAGQDTLDLTHFREARRAAQTELKELEQQLALAERHAAELAGQDGVHAQVSRVRTLAARVDRVLAMADGVPKYLRAVYHLLIDRIVVRRVADGISLVVVELPTGERPRALVITRRKRCSQPMRMWAHHLLASGMEPAEALERIKAWDAPTSDSQALTTASVASYALLHAHFECVSAREGSHRTAAELADDLGLSLKEVHALAMRGRLGPARIGTNDEPSFAPTDAECAAVSEDFARRAVATARGVEPNDLLLIAHVRTRLLLNSTQARKVRIAVPARARHTDAAGRLWVERHALPNDIQERLAAAGPEAARLLLVRTVEVAVRKAGYRDVSLPSWRSEQEILTRFRTRFGRLSSAVLATSARAGVLSFVTVELPPELRSKGLSRCKYWYCPASVWNARSLERVVAWVKNGPSAPKRGRHGPKPAPATAMPVHADGKARSTYQRGRKWTKSS